MNKDNQLWQFAVKFYAEPQVEEQLLDLQNENGLNINFLIFAIWLASENSRLMYLPEQENSVDSWHTQIINPIREVRYRLKKQRAASTALDLALGDCYQKLLATELAMEQVELMLLYEARLGLSEKKPGNARDSSLVKKNLHFYFKNMKLEPINTHSNRVFWDRFEQLVICAENILDKNVS